MRMHSNTTHISIGNLPKQTKLQCEWATGNLWLSRVFRIFSTSQMIYMKTTMWLPYTLKWFKR